MDQFSEEETLILQNIWDGIQNLLEVYGRIEKKTEFLLEKNDGEGAPKIEEKNGYKDEKIDDLSNRVNVLESEKMGIWKRESDGLELYPKFQDIEEEKRGEMMALRRGTLSEARLTIKDKPIKPANGGHRDYLRDATSNKVRRYVHKNLIKEINRRSIPQVVKEIRLHPYWKDTG